MDNFNIEYVPGLSLSTIKNSITAAMRVFDPVGTKHSQFKSYLEGRLVDLENTVTHQTFGFIDYTGKRGIYRRDTLLLLWYSSFPIYPAIYFDESYFFLSRLFPETPFWLYDPDLARILTDSKLGVSESGLWDHHLGFSSLFLRQLFYKGTSILTPLYSGKEVTRTQNLVLVLDVWEPLAKGYRIKDGPPSWDSVQNLLPYGLRLAGG